MKYKVEVQGGIHMYLYILNLGAVDCSYKKTGNHLSLWYILERSKAAGDKVGLTLLGTCSAINVSTSTVD